MTTGFSPEALLERLAPFGAVPRYWIAYSGGLDSTVLLDALAAIRARLPDEPASDRLLAVHVDHGLQAASADWARHCATRCAALGLPLRIERPTSTPSPGESLEAWAREARYALFRRLLAPGEILLTAQHRDDQAETLLLALLRGGGPHGLAAMPVVAPLGAGRLVRPLLDFSRQSLADYAHRQGLDWIEDPSNDHTAFDRNYLRHHVLPRLRARWPSVAATLSRSAHHCAEAAELIDQYAEQALAEARGVQDSRLSIPALVRLDRPLRKAVVRRWLKERGFKAPNTRHLERILDELPAARSDANPQVGWSGCEVRRYRDELFALFPLPPPPSESRRIDWTISGHLSVLDLPAGLGRLECQVCPEADSISTGLKGGFQLQVRFGQTGLICRVSATGARRPLKKLLQEAGVPAWMRPYLPLVFQGEQFVAAAGVAACHDRPKRIRLSSNTYLLWSGSHWQHDWPDLARPLRISLDVGGDD